jgi:hypothetical protein
MGRSFGWRNLARSTNGDAKSCPLVSRVREIELKGMKVMRKLVKKAALPVIALTFAASVADTKAQPDSPKPVKAAHYQGQVRNSCNETETYDLWRQLFGC